MQVPRRISWSAAYTSPTEPEAGRRPRDTSRRRRRARPEIHVPT